jgi:uncharacterized protein (TIGR02145 family)
MYSKYEVFSTRPVLKSPQNTSTITSTTPSLSCYPVLGAENYNYQVSVEPYFINSVVNSNSSSSEYQVGAGVLSVDQKYYWHVKATNSGVDGLWSDTWTFSTAQVQEPTIITTSVSNITSTTASSGGTITSDGGSPIIEKGVCWNTSQNPTITDSKISEGNGAGTFSSIISGLKPTTTYYISAYAINSAGTGYGDEISFTTLEDRGYDTVTIGQQVWMLKNLDVVTYRNGDTIPQVSDPTEWSNLTTGAWCYYRNSLSNGKLTGKLYNWYAVTDPRGLAPIGWHVPAEAEWETLENTLGGSRVAGGKLKEAGTQHWYEPNSGADNSSGFTALPGGKRHDSGSFNYFTLAGFWWSVTENEVGYVGQVELDHNNEYFHYYGGDNKKSGLSVRCVKD